MRGLIVGGERSDCGRLTCTTARPGQVDILQVVCGLRTPQLDLDRSSFVCGFFVGIFFNTIIALTNLGAHDRARHESLLGGGGLRRNTPSYT